MIINLSLGYLTVNLSTFIANCIVLALSAGYSFDISGLHISVICLSILAEHYAPVKALVQIFSFSPGSYLIPSDPI